MGNKRINKAYVRYDGSGRVIPGSLILNRFKPKVGNWQETPAYLCCNPVPQVLRMLFRNIEEVGGIIGDVTDVATWNTLFDLPTYGTPYVSVEVVGNEVKLYDGSNVILKESLFDQPDQLGTYLLEIEDTNTIVEIQNGAFGAYNYSGCGDLQTASFSAVTTVGEDVFYGCSLLTSISFPVLTEINNGFCDSCSALTSVSIPLLTTVIGVPFSGCTSLTSLPFPNLTTITGAYSFYSLNITSVDFPNLISAGTHTFNACTLLTSVNLPNLQTIQHSTFAGCSSLVNVSLPSLTTATDGGVFGGCTALQTVYMPLVTYVGPYNFGLCTSLTSVYIPLCSNLGGTVGYNQVFESISGNSVTLTIPVSRMTCNGGGPDSDIAYLQENNTATIVTV